MRSSSSFSRSSVMRFSLSSSARRLSAILAMRPCTLYSASCNFSTRLNALSLLYIPMLCKAPSCLSLPRPPGTLMSIRLLMYRLSSGAASYSAILASILCSRNFRICISCSSAARLPSGVRCTISRSASESISKKTVLYAPSFSAFLFPAGAPTWLPAAFFFPALLRFPG